MQKNNEHSNIVEPEHKGLKFFFPINEREKLEDGSLGSQTVDVVYGTFNARTNKRILRRYLSRMGVPSREHKAVLKAMGFWGKTLQGNPHD